MDYLILGGGSAGCVLAARLSENPAVHVTLVEAGHNVTLDSMAPHVRTRYPGRAYLDDNNIWNKLTAYMGAPLGNTDDRQPRRYEQGRLLGGGSAVNAMVANRGAPSDYDEWVTLGADGWNWDSVLPYFKKLERDVDFDGSFHGKAGPMPIRRITAERMSPFVKQLMATFEAQGYPRQEDQNGLWADGIYVGAVAVSDAGERVPTSVAYLTPEVRRRPNLEILTGHHALRLTFDGRRVTGAVVRPLAGGDDKTLSGREVIVCSGAIHTPALLMRSGIGPATELEAHGIAVIAARAGVGQNLMEHPSTAVSSYLPPHGRLGDLNEHHDHAILRYSSGVGDAPAGDMHIAMIARSGWHPVGQRIGTLFIWVNKAYSRGEVRLRSADPFEEPAVDFRLLSDWRDLERLKGGFRVGAKALADPRMDGIREVVFPTTYSPRVAKIAGPGRWNAIQRTVFAQLLDYAGPLRPALIHNAVTLGIKLETLVDDDKALTEFISGGVGGVWHASGTARMGRADDPLAVTDGAGAVYGVEGLRVVDASLMPAIPRANTNTPTIMIAERIADLIKAKRN